MSKKTVQSSAYKLMFGYDPCRDDQNNARKIKQKQNKLEKNARQEQANLAQVQQRPKAIEDRLRRLSE